MKVPSLVVLALAIGSSAVAAEPNPLAVPLAAEKPLYLDAKAPIDARVADLISRLTLEQKAALLNHKGSTVIVDGRPIRSDQWNQCLNGVSWNRPTTLFPTCNRRARSLFPFHGRGCLETRLLAVPITPKERSF